MTSAGVLGVGKMGRAVAARLAESRPKVSLWNRTRAKAAAAAESIGNPCVVLDTPTQLLSDAATPELFVVFDSYEVATTVLIQTPENRALLAGKTVYVLIAGPPASAETLATELSSAGATVVDAFFLGLPTQVLGGVAPTFFACSTAVQAAASTTLAVFGPANFVSEAMGSSKGVELCSGTFWQSCYLGWAAAMAFGQTHGVSTDALHAVSQATLGTLTKVTPMLTDLGMQRNYTDPLTFSLGGMAQSNRKHIAVAEATGLEAAAAFHRARLAAVEAAIAVAGAEADIRGCYEAFNPTKKE